MTMMGTSSEVKGERLEAKEEQTKPKHLYQSRSNCGYWVLQTHTTIG